MRLVSPASLAAAAMLLCVGVASADPASPVEKDWTLFDLSEFAAGALADVNEVEPNDTCPGNAYAWGDVFHAAISPAADVDWVTFSANAGDVLTLGTDADGATPAGDTHITLFKDDCTTQLALDDDGGPGLYSLIAGHVATYTGQYNLKIRHYSASGTGGYKFVGTKVDAYNGYCPLDNYKGLKFDANVSIPDNTPAGIDVGPIVFPPDGTTILDVVVDLGITHTWVGDLIVTLTHVSPACGVQSVDLINRPRVPEFSTVGCSGNLVGPDKYFFGTGALEALGEERCTVTLPPACYAVAPENANGLMVFRGCPKDGEWWLHVSDNAGGDLGTIVNFSVHLLNEGPVAVEQASWGSVKAGYR
jgi:subtilisin-like proprotein convertase family protein